MTKEPIINYLRTYRRRIGFSQDEVAFLLGGFEGTSVSRHERSHRIPLLANALIYELIFDVSIREIYPTVFRQVRRALQERARGLRQSLLRQTPSGRRDRKIAALNRLLGEKDAVI
jgi:transcriptional regulator with XRE-family HTH domain